MFVPINAKTISCTIAEAHCNAPLLCRIVLKSVDFSFSSAIAQTHFCSKKYSTQKVIANICGSLVENFGNQVCW